MYENKSRAIGNNYATLGGDMGINANTPLARESEVQSELNQLKEAVSINESLLAELSSRLSPILNQRGSGSDGNSAPEPVLVPLAQEIKHSRTSIELHNLLLLNLISSIEL